MLHAHIFTDWDFFTDLVVFAFTYVAHSELSSPAFISMDMVISLYSHSLSTPVLQFLPSPARIRLIDVSALTHLLAHAVATLSQKYSDWTHCICIGWTFYSHFLVVGWPWTYVENLVSGFGFERWTTLRDMELSGLSDLPAL